VAVKSLYRSGGERTSRYGQKTGDLLWGGHRVLLNCEVGGGTSSGAIEENKLSVASLLKGKPGAMGKRDGRTRRHEAKHGYAEKRVGLAFGALAG